MQKPTPKIVIGNWKMHGEPAMAHPLALAVAGAADALEAETRVVICPPAIWLTQLANWLVGSAVKLGGQDCHAQPEGAFTGDISAPMLKAAGCAYVIVGHSERRQHHNETGADVRAKAARAIATGLTPVICIGETDEQRSAGRAMEAVGSQIEESIPDEAKSGNFILAYEPVWAIGSGKTATRDDIAQMHTYIVEAASRRTGIEPEALQVLYGGSVKAGNAVEIMAVAGVAGLLVGGASLKAEEFIAILRSA